MIHCFFLPRWKNFDEILGGEEIRPYELITSLANLGEEVWVLLQEDPSSRPPLSPQIHFFPLRWHPPKPLHDLILPPLLLSKLLSLRYRRSSETILFYSKAPTALGWLKVGIPYHENPGYWLFPCLNALGFSTIAMIHDLEPEHSQRAKARGRMTPHPHPRWKAFEQGWAVRCARFAWTVSPELKEAISSRWHFPSSRCFVLYPGVNPELVRSLTPPKPSGVFTLGYVGSLWDADLGILLKAFYRLKEKDFPIRLKLGGVGIEKLSKEIPARFREDVEFCSRILYAQFPLFATDVDLWVIPYGRAPYLDMAIQLKIPILLSSFRPVLVERTRALERSPFSSWIIFYHGREEELARTIEEVLNSYPRFLDHAERARETLLRTATWSDRTREWLHFLQEAFK